jgi:hypothetical protein
MDNQRREQEASNPEAEELAKLEEELREAIAAEGFFNLASGKIWVKIAQTEVNKILNEITSDKFVKDHTGYVNALADLRAYKNILRRMQVAGSPQRKAKLQDKIEESA